jgi:hypothetical protein
MSLSDAPKVQVMLNQTALDQSANTQYLREGQGALLQCNFDAKPSHPVKLLWYRDGVPIPHATTRMLAITTLDRGFHGSQFTCEAKNHVGTGSGDLKLDVHCTFEVMS